MDNNSVTQAVLDSYAYGIIVGSLTFIPIAPWQLADIQSFLDSQENHHKNELPSS